MDNKKISIPKGKDDPSYRYKRSLLKISYQGNQKTKLENINEIAKSLITPPEYPVKFIGYELGSQTDIKNGEYTINGKHQLEKLEEILEKFIAKYILCQSTSCGLPEIKIFITNNEIKAKCTACPHVSSLDNKHKMASYIIKNPPNITSKIKGKTIDEGKKEKTVTSGTTTKDFTPDVKLIKNTVKKLNEESSKNNSEELDKLVDSICKDKSQTLTSPDCKYFVLFHGLFGKDLYQEFENRIPTLKQVINQESNITKEEAAYHVHITLINLIYAKYAKEEAVCSELKSQIPSLVYLLYNEEIFTEKFIEEKYINKTLHYKNFFLNKDVEKDFLEKAEPFIHWFLNAPFEDQEGEYKGIIVQEEKVVEKAISKVEQEIDDL